MNLLGLVFALLLIFSYGSYAVWDKHVTGNRLRNTHLSHKRANRALLNEFESNFYNNTLKRHKTGPSQTSHKSKKEVFEEEVNEDEKIPEINKECSRLNLWPLIQEGRESHTALYELAAKMIRTFYDPLLPKEKRFEYRFLNVWLASAKKCIQGEEGAFSLEKITLLDSDLQKIYYKMLKGTKKWDLEENIGYPPLQDYIKAEPHESKICVFHAHPDMVATLFNRKLAIKLCGEIHKKGGAPLTRELIERLGNEAHIFSIDPALFELIQLSGYLQHEDKKKIFAADFGDVRLRKNLTLQNLNKK